MTMYRYYGTLKLIIILWTSIYLQDAQAIRNPFEVVQRCPFNESEWKVRAAHTTCNGSESYHCLLTEGGVSLREQCTDASLFTSGFCPIFTKEGYLQWSTCKDTACPTTSYRSDEVYQYQICYQKTDNPIEKNTEKGSNDSSSVVTIIVAILLAFVMVSVLVSVLVFYRRNRDKVQQCMFDLRTPFQKRNDTESLEDVERVESRDQSQPLMQQDVEKGEPPEQSQPLIHQEPLYAKPSKKKTKKEPVHARPALCYEKHKTTKGIHDETCQTCKLHDLLNYLVHILKQELGVNDLKEKAVIHSKSINEHFSQSLIKDLQSLKDINDYSLLDTSLVYALLMNFCEGIKPPSRGWDYEPPDGETHVGADIERIRYMWNKYCDDDFELKHLDEVYNRMKQKYGTVAVIGGDGNRKPTLKDLEKIEVELECDGNKDPLHKDEENSKGLECMRIKIQSITLNPDCTVEKGIVITENIYTALKSLKSRNVVILKGVIGCGKTHALKAIKNHFQERDWKMAWVKSENFEWDISHEKPTIFLWDNLFGKFGASVFSQDAVNKTENALKEIESSKQETKVVIGIHTHVYDEVKKNLKLYFLHQKNITVEMDKLSDAEALLIFKEQLKKGHCKMDSNCWFKNVGFQSVLDKLSKSQGHIGGPFISLMYCNQHELFSDETFSANPVLTMVQHFQRMKRDSSTLFYCLVYLMCVQQHNIEEEPKEWYGQMSAEISKHNLMNLAKTFSSLQVENKIATPAHELLTTAFIKCAAEMKELFIPMLQFCESDVFLQLSRPADSTHSELYFEYTASSIYDSNESKKYSKDIGKMCAYRLAQNFKKEEINHPLMTVELVKEKYFYYLDRHPKELHLIK